MSGIRLIAAVLVALGLGACDLHLGPAELVQGSGHVKTESRDVRDFDGVALNGLGTLVVTQGATEALTIEAEDNILPRLRSVVEGGTLQLGPASGVQVHPTSTLRYELTVKQLGRIQVSGAGDVRSSRLQGGQLSLGISGTSHVNLAGLSVSSLTVDVSGAGDLTLAGQAAQQTATLNGSSKYAAASLASQRASVTVNGTGDCTVRVSERLAATINGAGHVSYYGSPTVEQSVTGAGSIRRSGD
jgi:hypothetical protein